MLLNTLRAEFTKLISTRSFWWTTALFFIISWGWAYLSARFLDDTQSLSPIVLVATFSLGLPILMIQAIMIVTTEYRFGLQIPTYLSNPNRVMVAAVKLFMYAVIAAVFMFLGVAGGLLLAQLASSGDGFLPDDGLRRYLWVYPVVVVVSIVFAQGLGLLLRQTAGTVAIVLIFHLGLDQLIMFVPKVGEKLAHFSPFGALQRWTLGVHPVDAPWGDSVNGYLVVAIVWAVVLWIAGVALLARRDA